MFEKIPKEEILEFKIIKSKILGKYYFMLYSEDELLGKFTTYNEALKFSKSNLK
tara:strand:+ start:887 stop:1048 length:162 start_codon:yes stop_codon:yes gene_type:complete